MMVIDRPGTWASPMSLGITCSILRVIDNAVFSLEKKSITHCPKFPFENPVPHVLTIPSRHHTQIQTGEKDSELTTRGRVQAQPPVPHW
jgi:hypothetical protein